MKTKKIGKYILTCLCLIALLIVLCLTLPKITSAHADVVMDTTYTAKADETASGADTLAFRPNEDYEPSEEVMYFVTFCVAIIALFVLALVYTLFRFVLMRNIVPFTRYRLAGNDDSEAVDIERMYAPSNSGTKNTLPKIKKKNYAGLITLGCVLAVVGALLSALMPMVNNYYIAGETPWLYLLMLIPGFAIFALFVPIIVNSYKLSKNAKIVYTVLAFVFAAACVVCYCVFIPEDILGVPAKVACSLFTFIIDFFAVTCVVPLDKSCKASVKAIKDGKITDATESV